MLRKHIRNKAHLSTILKNKLPLVIYTVGWIATFWRFNAFQTLGKALSTFLDGTRKEYVVFGQHVYKRTTRIKLSQYTTWFRPTKGPTRSFTTLLAKPLSAVFLPVDRSVGLPWYTWKVHKYPQQEQEQHQILKPFFMGFLGITTFPPTRPLYFTMASSTDSSWLGL